MSSQIRVMIIDDSALARKILSEGLEKDPSIKVVGTATGPEVGWERLKAWKPDVLCLDVMMEPVDGITFLRRFMSELPTPTVVVSSAGALGSQVYLNALAAGAISVVEKPNGSVSAELPRMLGELINKVKEASSAEKKSSVVACPIADLPALASAKVEPSESEQVRPLNAEVIALGTSTGGVAALTRLLPTFPQDCPGIVVVDHMPAGFTMDFAESLRGKCRIRVREAKHGDSIERGLALIAPGGDCHVKVRRVRRKLQIQLEEGPLVGGHRPAVNVLFESIAKVVGNRAAAAILTGMGRDGADGLASIRQAGGRTVAQNKATCVVFGMPASAIEIGAAEYIEPLMDVPRRLLFK